MPEGPEGAARAVVVCIAGMHRSGTSMVARVLNLCGIYLGRDDEFLAPLRENPAGFWESKDFLALNKDILAAFGGGWDLPPMFPEGWVDDDRIEPLRERACALLAKFQPYGLWGWKDPRNSLTLPFWRRLLPDLRVVVCLRNPLEVAGSLTRRGASSDAFGLALWLRYNEALLAATAPGERVVTHYEAYFHDAAAEIRRILAVLDLPADDDAVADAAASAQASLRHHDRATVDLVAAGVRADVVARYSCLCEEAGPVFAAVEREYGAERDAQTLVPPLGDEEFEPANVGHELEVARRELVKLRKSVADAEERASVEKRARATAEAARNELLSSRSFRYTAPLRSARTKVRRASRLRPRTLPDAALHVVRGMQRRVSERVRARSYRASAEDEAALERRLATDAPAEFRRSGPAVSVVIPNRNGERHLRRCLAALDRTEYEDFEVVVVDNGSTDGSVPFVERLDARFSIRLVRNEENRSFSQANNQGVDKSSGDLLLFLNNDVEPIGPGWLGCMVNTLLERKAVAVGARLVYPRRPSVNNAGDVQRPDLTLQHRGVHFGGGPDGMPQARNLGAGEDPCSPEALTTAEVPAVTAACMLVRRDAFADVGGFSEGYMYGTEDVDLCLRLRERGGRIVYDGAVALWHHELATQNAMGRDRKRANRTHNREVFLARWGPRVFREVLADRLSGARVWSHDPLHVAITVTRDDPGAAFGDWYTAHELGDAFAGLGWKLSYVERYRERWYDLDPSVDVLVVLLDAFELDRIPPHVVSVAWVRNWTDRWLSKPWFDDFDLVLASSGRTKELIEARSAKTAHLVPLATNPARFRPLAPTPSVAADLLFAGNYWKAPREVVQALPHVDGELVVKVFGRGWEKVDALRPLHAGFLEYDQLPQAYSSARIVLDDTGGHAKPYAAVNSRVFDALAAGAFVLSDNEEGVHELFDDNFPTWRDAETLRTQVAAYLADEKRRRDLVSRYRSIVLDRHTYERRAHEIRELLRSWCETTRYAIHIGVPDREQAESWGDYHYARGLQRQLERRGHPTRVALLPDWRQAHTGRADVAIHLFGLSELRTRSSQMNVLWVISHPDLVTAEMCERYDLVLVASDRFADELTPRVSVPLVPLHQATDPERFRPDLRGPKHELLFVANSRRVHRQIVDDLVGTPFDLAIYGRDWTPDLVDTRHVRGDFVPNRDLARYYASAAVVLNDHWSDMRVHGFLSNRLYDALAAGAFVISDHVDGIEEEFDAGVVTYTSRVDLHEKVERFLADTEARRTISARGRRAVLARHTFAHRVDSILALVEPLLGARQGADASALPASTRVIPVAGANGTASPQAARRAPPLPPERLRFMGEDDQGFLQIGDRLMADLRLFAGLGEGSDVLDVGSGYGRLAHALLRDGRFAGTYVGLDILKRHVEWCRSHLAAEHFQFLHLDVQNDRYNPTGALPATEVTFGLPSDCADVVVLSSVFTHMWPDEIRRYLLLVRDALRPEGRAYVTFFLLNDSWRELEAAGQSTQFPLPHAHTHFCRYMDAENPLHVVAYEQAWVLAELERAGLTGECVRLGSWCGRLGAGGLQDVIVARPA